LTRSKFALCPFAKHSLTRFFHSYFSQAPLNHAFTFQRTQQRVPRRQANTARPRAFVDPEGEHQTTFSSFPTDMSTLESLLVSHRQTLTTLYTKLSPAPLPLLTGKLDELHAALVSTVEQQRVEAEKQVDEVERRLKRSWEKVGEWRSALGESDGAGKTRGEGPLLVLVDSVEAVLEGMRSRMEERGQLIVGLQKRLGELGDVVGREWLGVELENVEEGWDGLDLRLERMSTLEREVMRCEAEIVGLLFLPSECDFRAVLIASNHRPTDETSSTPTSTRSLPSAPSWASTRPRRLPPRPVTSSMRPTHPSWILSMKRFFAISASAKRGRRSRCFPRLRTSCASRRSVNGCVDVFYRVKIIS
jgi:hypothetical protein